MKFTDAVFLNSIGSLIKKSGTNNWIVDKPFIWYVNYKKKTGLIYVYRGFNTDFGSIPQFFWTFFNPTKYVAYILHDFFYSSEYSIEVKKYSRKEADLILREALKVEGMGILKRNLVYLAVRCFGWRYFRPHP